MSHLEAQGQDPRRRRGGDPDLEGPAEGSTLSRRQFVQQAGALGLAVSAASLLAACGGEEEAAPPPTQPAAPQLEDEVNIIAWAQEWEFAKEPFQKETGVKVNMTFQDDLLKSAQKVKASPGEFDIVSYGPFDSPFVPAGLVQDLDPERLEHWSELPELVRQTLTDRFGGKIFMVPYYWGGTLLARETTVVPDPVDAWEALWDPKYKGKVAHQDQPPEVYARMALVLGFDISDYSEENLEKARDLALELIPNLKTFWSTGTDIQQLLARGEVGLTDVWDGTGRALVKEGEPVEVIFPKEGIRGWIDGPGLLVDAPHPNAAYAWINFVTRPEIGAQLAREFSYTPANLKSFGLLDEATKELILAEETESLFATGRFQLQRLTDEDNKLLSDWWQRTKVAAG